LSTVTQTYTGSTTGATSDGQPVYFDTSVSAVGVTLSGTTGLNVTSTGDFLFSVAAVVDQTTGTNISYEFWFLKNGALINNTNTRVTNDTATSEQMILVSLSIDLNAGDTVAFRWYCTSSAGTLKSTAAVGAVRPLCTSVKVAVNKISD
jgi:hypothetical protein